MAELPLIQIKPAWPQQAQRSARGLAMARHDWVFAISLAGTLMLAVGAIWILLFDM